MARTIDYYFTLLSPWAFLGHAPFVEIARRHNATINHKPVFLGRVFAETGGLPLAKRHPARQRYRMIELQRWSARRGLAFCLAPKPGPFDIRLADRTVIAILAGHQDPEPFIQAAFAAIWQAERDLSDRVALAEILTDAGYHAELMLERAEAALTEAIYALNQENAVEAGVFGSPVYALDGEVFWGQDRLDFLDEALTSGRAPFRIPA
jgi:2-hydroxychromene-2-carboxylate isomerase